MYKINLIYLKLAPTPKFGRLLKLLWVSPSASLDKFYLILLILTHLYTDVNNFLPVR